jgi:hypothetical protein
MDQVTFQYVCLIFMVVCLGMHGFSTGSRRGSI